MPVNENPKLVIGGLGGSGTRVVARILESAGLSMGDCLNESHDNLLFTALFKDPFWHKIADESEYFFRFGLFEKMMQGWELGEYESKYFAKVLKVNKYFDYELDGEFSSGIDSTWGWKEPNSHIYSKQLLEYFDQLKFVYVLRDGHYMAFSKNQQQLNNWGRMILTKNQSQTKNRRYKQLQFWINSNKRILRLGNSELGKRIYICNYNRLLENPEREINSLINFAGLNSGNNPSINDLIEEAKNMSSGRKVEFKSSNDKLISIVNEQSQLNGPLNLIKS